MNQYIEWRSYVAILLYWGCVDTLYLNCFLVGKLGT